ncbi:hypothetical protein WH47_11332 [Habropoda laboriosa]|uniref:Uncharacterized protein n=1 Tax=Habropoda laboriosa TaxID=597456 RepID=A0A0L7QLV3_9HYME|nr:hypothetical protein WH47_11332 [Habropoda laboriosa]
MHPCASNANSIIFFAVIPRATFLVKFYNYNSNQEFRVIILIERCIRMFSVMTAIYWGSFRFKTVYRTMRLGYTESNGA